MESVSHVLAQQFISNFPVTFRLIPLLYRYVDCLHEEGMSTLCNPIMERIS